MATINPGLILGPNLNTAEFTSGTLIKQIMLRNIKALPNTCFPFVDVRDCANAHLQAVKVAEAAGKRFICTAESGFLSTLSRYL